LEFQNAIALGDSMRHPSWRSAVVDTVGEEEDHGVQSGALNRDGMDDAATAQLQLAGSFDDAIELPGEQ
jgi:hypothetical protein